MVSMHMFYSDQQLYGDKKDISDMSTRQPFTALQCQTSITYIHRVHIKRCHWFFAISFTNMHGFLIIFCTQLCKWILIILANLLRCMACTSLTWWRNADVTEIMPFTVHVTLSPCCRERCQILSLQRCGHPFHQIWIQWTTTFGVSFKRGPTIWGSMMWRSWKNGCWVSGGCWTTPSLRQRLRNGVGMYSSV